MLRKLSFILAFAMLFSFAPSLSTSDANAKVHHHKIVMKKKHHRLHHKRVLYRRRSRVYYTPAVEHHSYTPGTILNRVKSDDDIRDAQERQ